MQEIIMSMAEINACLITHCDHCHIRFGSHESRVLYRGKKYHKLCYEKLFHREPPSHTQEAKFEC